jgi:hypothetical protein
LRIERLSIATSHNMWIDPHAGRKWLWIERFGVATLMPNLRIDNWRKWLRIKLIVESNHNPRWKRLRIEWLSIATSHNMGINPHAGRKWLRVERYRPANG